MSLEFMLGMNVISTGDLTITRGGRFKFSFNLPKPFTNLSSSSNLPASDRFCVERFHCGYGGGQEDGEKYVEHVERRARS